VTSITWKIACDIGAVLREEIARLSRRENRNEINKTRKETTQHLREIAQLSAGGSRSSASSSSWCERGSASRRLSGHDRERYGALRRQRMRSQRARSPCQRRIGKSRVSPQSIYNWEAGKRVAR